MSAAHWHDFAQELKCRRGRAQGLAAYNELLETATRELEVESNRLLVQLERLEVQLDRFEEGGNRLDPPVFSGQELAKEGS